MRWLLFLSRVAFICNILFLVSFSLRIYDWLGIEEIVSTIVIIGWVMAIIFNPVVNFCYLVIFWFKRQSLSIIPSWLIVMNILFLILQLIFLLLLNIETNPSA